jgi:AraC-like DNA-binding protein
MPGSTISTFGEPDDYQAALQGESGFNLVVTGRGEFRAQLTRIAGPRIHLLAGEENLSRIAFISLPQRMVRVSLPVRRGTQMFSGGIPSCSGEMVTHSGGLRLYERTQGPSRWQTVWLSMDDLMRHGRAIIGATFAIPSGACLWRPTPGPLQSLTRLYDNAIQTNRTHPRAVAGAESARGLEQQVLLALIECMEEENAVPDTAAARRHADLMSRFEGLVCANPQKNYSNNEICAALDVSSRTLLTCCKAHLGMGPLRYLRLRRMQLVRRALRDADPGAISVSEVAGQYGFSDLGRFAGGYRAQFGVLPSVTLHSKAER